MPARKQPKSLQAFSLETIGDNVFRKTVVKITEQAVSRHLQTSETNSWKDRSRSVRVHNNVLLEHAVEQLQNCLFEGTAHYFHAKIVNECLLSLSCLYAETVTLHSLEERHVMDNPSCRNKCPSSSDSEEETISIWKLHKIREDMQLGFIQLLSHTTVKAIDFSKEGLGKHYNLHWKVVARTCDLLADMTQLVSLDLGKWHCQQYGLLSDHGQNEGWVFKHLPNMKHVQASNVSSKFFQNLCTFCLKLETLRINSSDITDSVTKWVQNLRKLKMAELLEDRGVTPIGYAQLLRANPQLVSLGKCQCFGQVLCTLYSQHSPYRRSVLPNSIPEHLNLISVDTMSANISPVELKHLVHRCPDLRSVRFKYLPEDQGHIHPRLGDAELEEDFTHLHELASLENLREVSFISADFYGHQVYRLFEVRGDQLTKICLECMDELNLNAVILMGDQCPALKELSLVHCYFQMQPEDPLTVEKLIKDRKANASKSIDTCSSSGNNFLTETTKRIRSTSTSTDHKSLPLPFSKLETLVLDINTPTHLPIVEYILSFTDSSLKSLTLDQFFSDFGESFVTKTLFEWNCMQNLTSLHIGKAANLSLVVANVLLEKCPQLRKLGRLSSWRHITSKELSSFQQEIRLRNYDIEIY